MKPEAPKKRCGWAVTPEIMTHYHDTEWGVPAHDDRQLFEFWALDTFQAGISWLIVLNKRDNFRLAFDGFDVGHVAMYDRHKIERLLCDPGIIRNRMKIEATIHNARKVIEIQQELGSFDSYLWHFAGGKTINNKWRQISDIPAFSKVSDRISEDLRKRGFKFVGTRICYAFMQAAGLVNDHVVSCFRYQELKGS